MKRLLLAILAVLAFVGIDLAVRASAPPPLVGGFNAEVKMDGVLQYRGRVYDVSEYESFYGLQVTVDAPSGAFTLYPVPGHLFEIKVIQ